MLSKAQAERKDALQKNKDMELQLEDFKREKDKEARQSKENYDRCQTLYGEVNTLKSEIQAQHLAIIDKHKEIDSLSKTA